MGANSPTSCKVLTCLLNATWSRLIWLKLFSTCLQEHRLAETCQLVHARYISGPSKLPKTQCCASNRIWKRSTYQTAKLEGVRMTANTKCKPATVNSRIQHKHRHTNALYLNQLNSLVTSSHQPRFWRHIFIWLRESSVPHLKQNLPRKHTNYLTISLPLEEGEGENWGHEAQFWRKLCAAAAAQKHLGLIIHTQQNPGCAHPTEGTHKRFTSPSPTATRQSSRTSEPHLLQTSNESSTTLCRDDWNETPLWYFLVLFL